MPIVQAVMLYRGIWHLESDYGNRHSSVKTSKHLIRQGDVSVGAQCARVLRSTSYGVSFNLQGMGYYKLVKRVPDLSV